MIRWKPKVQGMGALSSRLNMHKTCSELHCSSGDGLMLCTTLSRPGLAVNTRARLVGRLHQAETFQAGSQSQLVKLWHIIQNIQMFWTKPQNIKHRPKKFHKSSNTYWIYMRCLNTNIETTCITQKGNIINNRVLIRALCFSCCLSIPLWCPPWAE